MVLSSYQIMSFIKDDNVALEFNTMSFPRLKKKVLQQKKIYNRMFLFKDYEVVITGMHKHFMLSLTLFHKLKC